MTWFEGLCDKIRRANAKPEPKAEAAPREKGGRRRRRRAAKKPGVYPTDRAWSPSHGRGF
jgi:hypothetical protein